MKKYLGFIILMILCFAKNGTTQTCTNKIEKTITEQTPLNVPCADLKARDYIALKPGFSFSSTFKGQNKIVELTWTYSGLSAGWYPYVKINSTTCNGTSLPSSHSEGNFFGSIYDLAGKLKTALGTDWNVYAQTPNGNSVSIRIENFSDFTYNSSYNYISSTIVQAYNAAGTSATFNARIDNSMLFPVDYLTGTNVPDPLTRTLDKTKYSFGSLPGEVNVSPSGAATYNIPIEVLPGINGMAPQLTISYNSQTGNGILGWGWNIGGLTAISRVPQNVYSDPTAKGLSLGIDDRFSLNGNRLVVTESTTYGNDNSLYRTETETFVVVKAHVTNTANGPDWFEVVDKNGTTYKYGSATGRVVVGGKNFSWQLDYIEDINGNYMQYTYENIGTISYIKKIEYGRNISDNSLITNTVEFFYETRVDVQQFKLLQNTSIVDKILNKIRIARGNIDYRNYTFEYAKDVYSRLVKINLTNPSKESFNPTIIKWGIFNNTIALNNNITAGTSYQASNGINMENQYFFAADINNDGKSDLLSLHGNKIKAGYTPAGTAIEGYINNSGNNQEINFANGSNFYVYQGNANAEGSDYKLLVQSDAAKVMDIDNNGITDFIIPLYTQIGDSKYIHFLHKINNFDFYDTNPNKLSFSFSGNDLPAVALADFNNNGKTDICYISKTTYACSIVHLNFNSNGEIASTSKDDFQFSGITGEIKQIFDGDYNGDGLIDILVVSNDGSYLFKNYGGANASLFKNAQGTSAPWISLTDFIKGDYPIIKTGDFNGDGAIDFVYEISKGNWKLATGNNNGTFTVTSLPFTNIGDDPDTGDDDNSDNCYVFDFDLDGKSDIVIADYVSHWVNGSYKEFDKFDVYWYKSTGSGFTLYKKTTTNKEIDTYYKYFVMGDFNGDGRTDLMNYGSDLLNFSNSDRKWRLYAAGTINAEDGLVTSVSNGLNQKTTINYNSMVWSTKYTHQTLASENLYSRIIPLSIVEQVTTSKNTGPYETQPHTYKQATFNYLKGFLGFAETSVANNRSNLKTTMNYDFSIALNTSENLYLPLLTKVTQSVGNTEIGNSSTAYKLNWYGGKWVFIYPYEIINIDKKMDYKKVKITTPYDVAGNLTSTETKYFETEASTTETALNLVTSAGFLPRVTGNINQIASQPGTITTTKSHKDDNGGSWTQTSTFTYNSKGQVATKLVDGVTTTLTYDAYGNISSSSDASSYGTRNMHYTADPTKRFIKEVWNDFNHKTTTEYDNWGNKITVTDPNNHVASYTYNNWGTPLTQTSPDGTVTKSLTTWSNGDANAPVNTLYATYDYKDNIQLSAGYFDPDGVLLQKNTNNNFGANVLVSYSYYSTDGKLWKVSDPYPSGTTPSRQTIYEYDTYKRLTKTTTPDGLVITNSFPTSAADRTYTISQVYSATFNTGTTSKTETSSKKYDAAGLVTSASDKGGTITYLYHRSLQPASITANGATTTITYYDNGKQHTLADPDAGTTTYEYNGFGELWKQTSAQNILTQIEYDAIGRVTTKTIGSKTYTYTYDPANGKGQLASETCTSDPTIAGYSYTYDGLSRLATQTRSNNAASFIYSYQYGSGSKVSSITYPNNFKVQYIYNNYDDLVKISDGSNNLIWKVDENDTKGRITKTSNPQKQLTISYDENDHLSRLSVPNVINFGYHFNSRGQLEWRDETYFNGSAMDGFEQNDALVKEYFSYDEVNRLVSLNIGTTEKLRMVYQTSTTTDRIDSKSDAGTYVYDETTNHCIDKLTPVSGYTPAQHDLTYTLAEKVATIKEKNNGAYNKQLTLDYGLDDQRFKTEYTQDGSRKYTRYYFDTYEKETLADNSVRHLNYIYAGGNLIAIFEQKTGGDQLHYVYTDYLGSLRCITNAAGTIEQRLSFDAWGNRRNPFTGAKLTDAELATATTLTSRGFTGHEHIDGLGLINMNGRVYDPMLGMFLSPDKYVQAPYNSQNYNRYSYCVNNPLMYTDPSGEVFGIDDAIAILAMAYMGGMQSNFMYCSEKGTNLFNPGNWNWNNGQTYTSIATGAISGAGLVGINILPTVPGAIFNGALQAGFNVGINGVGNAISGDPFFQGAAVPVIMGFGSGAIAGYNLAKKMDLNPWTGAMKSETKVALANGLGGYEWGERIPETDAKRVAELMHPDLSRDAAYPTYKVADLDGAYGWTPLPKVDEIIANPTGIRSEITLDPYVLKHARRFYFTTFHELNHAKDIFNGTLYNELNYFMNNGFSKNLAYFKATYMLESNAWGEQYYMSQILHYKRYRYTHRVHMNFFFKGLSF